MIPVSKDGVNSEENMALACRSCNLFKSEHLTGTDPVTNQDARLFHPRRDGWEENFRANVESGLVEGLTSIGRATVARLRMNSALQIQARRVWMNLDVFP